jgi:hypothetical protein
VTRIDPAAASLDVKRTAMLLRDARAVLRRVDVLMAAAAAVDDPAVNDIAVLRSDTEHLVAQLARRESTQQRRARAATRHAR